MAGPALRTWEDKAGDWVYVTICLKIRKENKPCGGTGPLP